MTKSQYEVDRDERVRNIQEHFKSLGIPILAQEVRDGLSQKKRKRKTVDKKDGDHDYDPSSDIDSQSDTDDDSHDDCDDELINLDNTKVGAMVPGTRLKKQKTIEMAAANLPPRSPTKFTRQQVKSEKNKQNRSKVQLHQKTGSRSYIAHRYSLELMVAEKDREPEAAAEAEACMKAEFEATLQAEREEAARKQEEL